MKDKWLKGGPLRWCVMRLVRVPHAPIGVGGSCAPCPYWGWGVMCPMPLLGLGGHVPHAPIGVGGSCAPFGVCLLAMVGLQEWQALHYYY